MKHRLLPGITALIVLLLASACGGSDKPSSNSSSGSSGDSTPGASSTNAPAASTPADGASTTPPKASIEQLVLIQPSDNQTSVKLNSGVLTTPPAAVSEAKASESGSLGSEIQVIYKLSAAPDAGVRTAWVSLTLRYGKTELARVTRVSELGKWDGTYPFSGESHPPNGDYELEVKVLPNGDTKTAKLKVTGAPEIAAKLAPPIMVSEGVIAKGTVFIGSYMDRAKTSFKTTDYIALLTSTSATEPVPSALMTATWKRNGQQIGEPAVSINTLYTGLREFTYSGPKIPGDYEATVTVASTGESAKVAFKIEPGAPAPGAFAQAGMVRNLLKDAEPDAKGFVTTADASDKIALAFTLASSDAKGTEAFLTFKRTYEGTDIPSFGTPDRRGTWYVEEFDRSGSVPLPAGKYEVTVTNSVTSEKKTLAYTISSTGKLPPPAAKISTAGVAEVALGPTGTPTAAYKTNMSTSAAAVTVYYTMDAKGGDSAVKAVWKYPDGRTLTDGGTKVIKAGASDNFSIGPTKEEKTFAPGTYSVTLTVVTTGDTKFYQFTVK